MGGLWTVDFGLWTVDRGVWSLFFNHRSWVIVMDSCWGCAAFQRTGNAFTLKDVRTGHSTFCTPRKAVTSRYGGHCLLAIGAAYPRRLAPPWAHKQRRAKTTND